MSKSKKLSEIGEFGLIISWINRWRLKGSKDGKYSQVVNGSNTPSNPNNAWNGLSTAFNADGIDVDTFYVPWSRNLLSPGDTSAHIDLCTAQDNWNLVFIILSFRSKATTGGSVTYLIH